MNFGKSKGILIWIGLFCSLLAYCTTWDATRFVHDPATGLLLKKIYPDGHEISYGYWAWGLPRRITYASGKWKERFYNERLQTVSNIYSSAGTPAVLVHPNALGTVCRAEDAWGLVYDYGIRPLNQLLTNETVTSSWMSWQLAHSHDQFSRENGLSLTVGHEKKGCSFWRYDHEGRFSNLVCTNSSGRAIEVCYVHFGSYACGYRIRMPAGGLLEQIWDRDESRKELTAKLTVRYSGSLLFGRNYKYDALGRITRWSDTDTTREGVYWYSPRREVVQADVAGIRYGYGFDSAANCLGFAIDSITNYFRANQLNQCAELIFPSAGRAVLHEYDLDGNLVHIPGMAHYAWDDENRLILASVQQGLVTNRYDYQNRLVRQLLPDGTRSAIFDRWNLIFERFENNAGHAEEVEYFWGPDKSGTLDQACGVGGLVAVSLDGLFYFPYYGPNGEILGYVNEEGIIVASYVYGPFGEPTLTSGSMASRFSFRYMTKRWDPVIGLYDFGERWYSIALRRWISRDPLGEDGGLNLYAFCNNDPVNTFDPNGCIPLDTVWDLANVVYDICVGDDVALAADSAALFVPYLPAGATKLAKAARLSKVERICPGVKSLTVTYEYLPAMAYKGGRHTLPRSAETIPGWWKRTRGREAKFLPGWGDTEIKGLIEEAFAEAKRQGKFKPHDLDGFVYDARRIIGASNGKKTTRIRIHVNSDGKNLHAFPEP